jgi:hypothetical protein
MKKLMLLIVFCAFAVQAQYTENTALINNPDRGLFFQASTWDDLWPYNYLPLSEEENFAITAVPSDVSLVRLIIRLDDYRNPAVPIPDEFVQLVREDLELIRARHMKCILRFSYWDDESGNPTDASLSTILAHIEKFKPLTLEFEGIISSMEAGFIGRYGEWHDSTNFGNPINETNAKTVADGLFSMTLTRFVAFRTPTFMRYYYPSSKKPKMRPYYTNTKGGRTAMYNDGFVHGVDDDGTYANSTDRDYLEMKSAFSFTGGEPNENDDADWEDWATCDPNAPNSLGYGAVEQMEKYHWNHLHYRYWMPVLDLWDDEGCYGTIRNRLGYRYLLTGTGLDAVQKKVTVNIQNVGFANCFNNKNVYLVLKDISDNKEYKVNMSGPVDTTNILVDGFMTSIQTWLAGGAPVTLYRRLTGLATSAASSTVPANTAVPAGPTTGSGHTYDLYLEINDPLIVPSNPIGDDVKYSVRLASKVNGVDVWQPTTGYNKLFRRVTIYDNSITVVTKPGGNTIQVFEVAASRNPFGDNFELSVNTESDEPVTIGIFDMVGKMVGQRTVNAADAKAVTLGGELANGIYNIVVTQGGNSKAVRVIKQ